MGTKDRGVPQVGGTTSGERAILISTADRTQAREPVTYESSGTWLVIAILVIMFLVFFGVVAWWSATH